MRTYTKHFNSHRHNVSDKARQYTCGLLQCGNKKNMDRMSEIVPGSKSRNLQQFTTHSTWDHREVIDHVASDVDHEIGDEKKACLLLDETGIQKQGKESVGVARQWLGRIGKVDNGQVAVFGALANGIYVSPVDVRLYLPQKWTEDPTRCEKAGIPKECRTFKTKDHLALDIVRHARENKLRFGWVGADGGYGKGPGFCIELEKMGERFIIDVHSDVRIYMTDPKPFIPQKTKSRGRKPSVYKTEAVSRRVSDIVADADLSKQKVLRLRKTSRGDLAVRAARIPVFVWDGTTDKVYEWSIIATQSIGKNSEIKISLCNFDDSTSLKELAFCQRQRYFIERTFQDAKGECGMADYQVRKWKAWHHHMALVMMAMLFMLTEKKRQQKSYPLLSYADIELLLNRFLPRKDLDENEVIRQLEHRHKMRRAAIINHACSSEKLLLELEGSDG